MNGPFTPQGLPTIARCERQSRYLPIPNYNTLEGRLRLAALFNNHYDNPLFHSTSLVFSDVDRTTTLNMQSVELDAGIAGAARTGGQVGSTSEQKCENCSALSTGVLDKGTDFVSAEATMGNMLGTAGAAAAGILWLTALSG